MDQSETLARVEKLTRAVLSSDDEGVPLARFASDYQRMTRKQFPWREHGFNSARDMLLSMENVVEFKFSDQENQFYLIPAHVTCAPANSVSGSSHHQNMHDKQFHSTSTGKSSRLPQHGVHNVSNPLMNSSFVDRTQNEDIPPLVEPKHMPDHDVTAFAADHHGRVSVYVCQSAEKPAKSFWNKPNLTKLFSPFGKVIDVALMANKISAFVRYKTVEEAKHAAESLNGIAIPGNENKLVVRPGLTRDQKIGQGLQVIATIKKQPIRASKPRPRPTNAEEDDDVWDDGLLPKNSHCNGIHSNKGTRNGMATACGSIALREMFVSEVISPGLLWLKDASLSGRDLQLLSLSIDMQREQLNKLPSWTLPKEGNVYCINIKEVNKAENSTVRWYRVIVNQVLQSSEQVEVRYVDTGVEGTLSMAHLYALPLSCQLQEVPPAVFPCHMWGVASNHDNRKWWPLDCQLLWSLIRNKKVFAKLRSDVIQMFSDSVENCVPVELYFDAGGKLDVRDELIKSGHFIMLTDTSVNDSRGGSDKDSSSSPAETATPTQEGVATMWKPSPRKANTDPLHKPHRLIQTHNQSLPLTSPSSMMWRPKKLVPASLSFSEQ